MYHYNEGTVPSTMYFGGNINDITSARRFDTVYYIKTTGTVPSSINFQRSNFDDVSSCDIYVRKIDFGTLSDSSDKIVKIVIKYMGRNLNSNEVFLIEWTAFNATNVQ